MGVDLRLLPYDADGTMQFSHTMLSCERRRELWDVIKTLPSLQVDKGFTSYFARSDDGEYEYGETTTTPYGEKLRYTTVVELLKVETHEGVTDNHKNRAIWSYLSHLPLDTKVALFWC